MAKLLEDFTPEALDFFMKKALEVSFQALGKTGDNPPVGCVFVESGKILARGFTQAPGEDHAEASALRSLQGRDLSCSICFCTLEPCSFQGRTPSCAKTLIQRGVGAVVVSLLDPHPRNQGLGIQLLREAGIEVIVGVLEGEVRPFLEPHLYRASS
jgi:pyrimidine deaminase RibD-like protein